MGQTHIDQFFLLEKYHQKTMGKKGLQNSLILYFLKILPYCSRSLETTHYFMYSPYCIFPIAKLTLVDVVGSRLIISKSSLDLRLSP